MFLFFQGFCAKAQYEVPKDTLPVKEWKINSAVELGDTVWWALQQKTTDELLGLTPDLKVIRATFDSLEIKNNPQLIKLKYNYIRFNIKKQVKNLNKKAKRNNLKFKTSELESIRYKEGKDEKNNAFAYVYLECRKGKKTFKIKFVALQLNNNWYLTDELELVFPEDDPYVKPPVKKKGN
ncbi:MAG: hypothetical protein H6605_07290 [Flavobacteriales bacterium]|nr:hypothetical protein [Flavobacteriales bacterium]